jgi:hypothetical protein
MVFTEIQDTYETAGDDFKKDLTAFNQSLQDANLSIVIGTSPLDLDITDFERYKH